MGLIYKILRPTEWLEAQIQGVLRGSPVDIADGFIHFSGADQVRETITRHFQGESSLILLSVAPASLGDGLLWERSRGGDMFPHLYAPLALYQVTGIYSLMREADGRFRFPAEAGV